MDGSPETFIHRGHLTNHCLLLETEHELILIDTGLGLKDVENSHSRLSGFFLSLLSPDFRKEMTAFQQIQRMGFSPKDVRHIILTQLDFDHAGGLDDFPWARVHLMHAERDSAFLQQTWVDRQRYRPQQWGTKANWSVYRPGEGGCWFGFGRVQQLENISLDIAMIPLIGHTLGHAGVAVKTSDKWLLHAGDAYFFRHEIDMEKSRCTQGLNVYQRMMEKDRQSRLWNQQRLRELRRDYSDQVEIFCAHDLEEFEKISGRPAEIPANKILGQNHLLNSQLLHL